LLAAAAATLQSLLLASRKCLSKMSPQDLANTIAALPELGARPDQAWLDAFCTTAAAKMPQASALALYAILFGLARVQQAEKRMAAAAVKAQKVAAARQQRQQQQQQQGSGDMADAQALADTAAATEATQQQTAVSPSSSSAAAAEVQAQHAASPAQVKLLRAAALWLLRMQQHLTQWQLAGVIMSIGELLPREVLRQVHGGAEVGSGHTLAAGEPETPAASEPGLPADLALQGSKDSDAIKQQQRQLEFIGALQKLIEGWRPLVEQGQLASVLPKQKAKLLVVAWQRLQPISNSVTDSKHDAASGDAAPTS
jgi:hypothetical protein